MDQSSEYTFPIFISSTDYNLKDLRAELARFLTELGYRPILSSADGFPDSSPKMEPWESCIPVLEHAFVMILVIDGKYGTELEWVNSAPCLQDKEVSPTHGEYLYAHYTRKRMLVFIREEVMTYYQSYRTTFKNCKKDLGKTKEVLCQTLPDYIDFKTLEFVHQVKTTKPIPWLKEFKDITDIKKEVQKKMLNELAELFLIKTAKLDTVIDSFDKVMDTLSIDEQKKVLGRIGATKELVKTMDEIAAFQRELDEKTKALSSTEVENKQQREKYETEIKDLKTKIKKLEQKSQASSDDNYYIRNGSIQVNPNYVPLTSAYLTGTTINGGFGVSGSIFGTSTTPKCDRCHMPQVISAGLIYGQSLRKCPKCERMLCNTCWPNDSLGVYIGGTSVAQTFTIAGTSNTNPKVNVCPDCARTE